MKFTITFLKSEEAPFFTAEIRAEKSQGENDPTPSMFYQHPDGKDYVSLGPGPFSDEQQDLYGESVISRGFWNLEDAEEWVDHLMREAKDAIETWRAIELPENRTIEI